MTDPLVEEAVSCRFKGCWRVFRTVRGARRHEPYCCMNFEQGDYLPIRNRRGQIVGSCRATPEAIASFRGAASALGLEGDVQHLRLVEKKESP